MKSICHYSQIVAVLAVIFLLSSCDKKCSISLKNGTPGEVKIMTHKTGSDGKMVENAVTLKQGEELKLGECKTCEAIEENEIEVEQMLVVVGSGETEMKDKKEVLQFLSALKSGDCGVKIFE